MNYYRRTGDFGIRFAGEQDSGHILSFIKELAEYEKLGGEVVATEESLRETIFVRKQAEVIIGEENGLPVAFALFFHNYSTFLGKAGMYLEDLFVLEAYRGRGYGKQMFKCLGAIAAERGCGRLDWWCLDWNKPSIDFYLKMGATDMKDWTVYRLQGEALSALASEEL